MLNDSIPSATGRQLSITRPMAETDGTPPESCWPKAFHFHQLLGSENDFTGVEEADNEHTITDAIRTDDGERRPFSAFPDAGLHRTSSLCLWSIWSPFPSP
ncbi:hypothetical protein GQ607_015216 [Colletotrichum asianum]|uniref:Uncharacterized protein n=1 Tax=Colletotrichum asianum TaxID=702518 RepID=A0A8H3ZFT0_9PEZI|nr:hypothetical protein GQ607_015216 [Colletotrichum asianum]